MLLIDCLLDVLEVFAGDHHGLVHVAAALARPAYLAPGQVEERVVQWCTKRIVVGSLSLSTCCASVVPYTTATHVLARCLVYLVVLMVRAYCALAAVTWRF